MCTIQREKLQKEAMKAEAELKRVRLKEEKNQLKEVSLVLVPFAFGLTDFSDV